MTTTVLSVVAIILSAISTIGFGIQWITHARVSKRKMTAFVKNGVPKKYRSAKSKQSRTAAEATLETIYAFRGKN